MGTVRTLWLSLSSVVAAGSLILGGADCLAADETQVNTYTLNGQTDPSVAMDADGDSVVTWESYGQSGGAFARSDVYAQRFDSNGDPSGVEFAVYAASYDQRNPATAMDGDGNFVIVFETDISGMSSFQIWGWRYAANGAFLGSQFITNDSISKQFPSIAMASGSGNFVVAWDSPDASSYGIYARRYNDQGIPYAAIFPVNTETAGVQTKSSIGMDNYSNFLVAWESHGGQDGDGIGVFGQMYTSSGTNSGSEFQVNSTTAGDQTNPSVAMSWNGRAVVVWESSTAGNLSTYDIYARRVNLNGSPAGEEFRVNTTTESYQGRPSVAMDAIGNFVVAWDSQGQDGSFGGVYARKFDYNGNPLSGEFLVNTTTSGSQTLPAVAADLNTGRFVTAWQGPDGNGDGIFMSWPLEVPLPTLFSDGFESGDVSAWTSSMP